MSKQKVDDAERARRIRDAQLSQRNPGGSKIKGYDWSKHAQRGKQIQKSRQKPLLADLFDLLPSRWKGAVMGIVVGLVPFIAALIFLRGDWAILGLAGLLLCAIIGFVVGASTANDVHQK